MLEYWNALSFTTRFSIIAFIVTIPMGLFSMGILGAVLYYPVSILFPSCPSFNDWRGDWVWPAIIGVGMAWSVGFLLAGLAWHYLSTNISSVWMLRCVYGLILYGWAGLLWWLVLQKKF